MSFRAAAQGCQGRRGELACQQLRSNFRAGLKEPRNCVCLWGFVMLGSQSVYLSAWFVLAIELLMETASLCLLLKVAKKLGWRGYRRSSWIISAQDVRFYSSNRNHCHIYPSPPENISKPCFLNVYNNFQYNLVRRYSVKFIYKKEQLKAKSYITDTSTHH